MSLWGATVITNLMSAIPWVGQDIVEFIWGGFSVNNATLNRFFALHFVLPFVLAALALMHLIALHDSAGSGNPLGISANSDRLPFAPYFIFKDLITIFIFIIVLSVFVFFMPNVLGDSENYVMANPMQTPPAIVPEWYLLPFYAILRSIPNKLLGVIAMFSAILALLAMPFTDLSRLRGIQFRPLSKIAFFIFIANFLILMQLGAKHVESPFIEFGQISTALYFAHFFVIVPFVSLLENSLIDLSTQNSVVTQNPVYQLVHLNSNLNKSFRYLHKKNIYSQNKANFSSSAICRGSRIKKFNPDMFKGTGLCTDDYIKSVRSSMEEYCNNNNIEAPTIKSDIWHLYALKHRIIRIEGNNLSSYYVYLKDKYNYLNLDLGPKTNPYKKTDFILDHITTQHAAGGFSHLADSAKHNPRINNLLNSPESSNVQPATADPGSHNPTTNPLLNSPEYSNVQPATANVASSSGSGSNSGPSGSGGMGPSDSGSASTSGSSGNYRGTKRSNSWSDAREGSRRKGGPGSGTNSGPSGSGGMAPSDSGSASASASAAGGQASRSTLRVVSDTYNYMFSKLMAFLKFIAEQMDHFI